MKLIDIYNIFNDRYSEYVIMIKSGHFYEVYGDGAIILNNLFNYKIKNVSGGIRVGFPVGGFNRVTDKLSKFKINHLVLENTKCTYRKRFDINGYNEFVYKLDIDDRINNIVKRIYLIKDNPNINNILDYIERNI